MMFSIGILAISLSVDALGVGLSYGLRRIKIPAISKFVICFFSIIYSAFAITLGKSLLNILPVSTAKLIGVFILAVMGIWMILQGLLKKPQEPTYTTKNISAEKTLFRLAIKSLGITVQVIKNPSQGDIDKSGVIDISESLLLGLALSIDAIGVGIGSSLAGFHSILIPFAVGLCQLIFIYIGTYAGHRFSLANKADSKLFAIVPGILLIILALLRV